MTIRLNFFVSRSNSSSAAHKAIKEVVRKRNRNVCSLQETNLFFYGMRVRPKFLPSICQVAVDFVSSVSVLLEVKNIIDAEVQRLRPRSFSFQGRLKFYVLRCFLPHVFLFSASSLLNLDELLFVTTSALNNCLCSKVL